MTKPSRSGTAPGAVRLLGLTGGIASGKSTAARIFREAGCPIIDADAVAREVVEPGTPALQEIAAAFSDAVLRPDGTLDREALGARVFSDPAARERLNRIVHPRVRAAVAERLRAIGERQPGALVAYDVPLLYEAGMEDQFERVVVVYAPRAVQRERLQQRDNLTAEEADLRLEAQMDIEEKARRADEVLDNRSSVDELRLQIHELLARLQHRSDRDDSRDFHFGVDNGGTRG